MPRSKLLKPRDFYVLLDRDGTLIEEKHYLSNPNQVALIPGAGMALKRLNAANIGVVLLTNQSGLARGYFDENALIAIHLELARQLKLSGVNLDGIYVCPHLPETRCKCRKPRPGLALTAADELGIKLTDSIVIGDKDCDIALGKALGAKTILVCTGHGESQSEKTKQLANFVLPSLVEACQQVLIWQQNLTLSCQENIRYE